MKLQTEFNPPFDDLKHLENQLLRHNSEQIEGYEYQDVMIKALAADTTLTGGLHGQIGGGWMYIASLWVHRNHRGRQIGTALLNRAESIAIERQCTGIYLYTYSFQNPGFYEKQGYRTFGSLDRFWGEHSKLYMKKSLVDTPSEGQPR